MVALLWPSRAPLWSRNAMFKSGLYVVGLLLIGGVVVEFALMGMGIPHLVHVPKMPLFLMPKPSITVAQGTYVGTTLRGDYPRDVEQFLGIPYALDTGGQRRFRPPVKVPPGDGKFTAIEYGERCWSTGDQDVKEGDDCLNLNIWRPKGLDRDHVRPVVVFFHGGAFNGGNARGRDMASMVAWSDEAIVGVSFNYRVGAMGFLPSALTAKEGLLNIGLKDQDMLMQWVRDNIQAFGGDPEAVTIMGTSAGAHSVGHHLMNTDRERLFSKVIMESGGPTARAVYPPDHVLHENQFAEFLELLEVTHIPESELMDHLRTIPPETLKAASETIYRKYNPSLTWPFQPVIDGPGGIIPQAPITSWKERKYHKIPIMTGFNTHEGAMFVPKQMATPEEFDKFFLTLQPRLNATDIEELNRIFRDPGTHPDSIYADDRAGVGPQFKRVQAAYSHYAYIGPVRHTAYFASGRQQKDDNVLYLYNFATEISVIGGADHNSQNDYIVYPRYIAKMGGVQEAIASHMHAYWASFIITGNPNDVKVGKAMHRETWPAYGNRGSSAKMNFGAANDIRAGGTSQGMITALTPDLWGDKECKFWWDRTILSES